MDMKLNIVTAMLLLVSGVFAQDGKGKQHFDRPGFYAAIASENLDSINAQVAAVKGASFSNKEAFEGTLLMTKAGLVPNPANKLSLFKSGHKKLENSIKRESKNAELRFLRLMIQEHAPKILNYNDAINEDSQMIQSSFKSLLPAVQQAVVDYSKKNSKVLKDASF